MYRLHRELQTNGLRSTIACRRKEIESPDVVELPRSHRIENLLGKVTWRLGLNDLHCVSSFKVPRFQPFQDADVVNIHGLHTNFFNYLALPSMARNKPIVLTLHDMWHLTGHCAMSFDCDRWKTGCGSCPYLDVFPPVSRDATAITWRLKNWTYKRTPMTVVSPSKWLAERARQSMLSRFPIHHIPNGVDVNIFKPMGKKNSRSLLDLPTNKHVILFASAALDNPAKGGALLIQALQSIPAPLRKKTVLLLLGDQNEAIQDKTNIETVALGYVRDDETKIAAYSAADVFVLPSRFENHSLVLLEALACGTPGIAFDVGGNPEIIRHKKTGFLARLDDVDGLREGIVQLLEDAELRREMSKASRKMIEKEFSLELHAKRYIELFENVVESRKLN